MGGHWTRQEKIWSACSCRTNKRFLFRDSWKLTMNVTGTWWRQGFRALGIFSWDQQKREIDPKIKQCITRVCFIVSGETTTYFLHDLRGCLLKVNMVFVKFSLLVYCSVVVISISNHYLYFIILDPVLIREARNRLTPKTFSCIKWRFQYFFLVLTSYFL